MGFCLSPAAGASMMMTRSATSFSAHDGSNSSGQSSIFLGEAASLSAKVKQVGSPRRCVLLAILSVEILSQPILATSPILLNMTTAETLQWFGISAAMPSIWGAVLGAIVSTGLRPASVARQG